MATVEVTPVYPPFTIISPEKKYYIVSRFTYACLTADSLKDGSKVVLKPMEIDSGLQIWTWANDVFHIDGNFTLEAAPMLATPQIKSYKDNAKWKVTPEGFMQHQRSIQYLGIAKENVKEGPTLKCKKLSDKLSQSWMFVEKDFVTKEYLSTLLHKSKHVALIDCKHSISLEITNSSKHTLCQPNLTLTNAKYDDLPYFIKNSEEKSVHDVSEQIIVYGREEFSGYLTYSIFDDGVEDDLLLVAFNWKDKKFHVQILNEKDLVSSDQVLNTYLSKESHFCFSKTVKCFARLYKGKKFGIYLEFSDNDGTEWKEPSAPVDQRGSKRSFELRELRKSGEKMFSHISTLIKKPGESHPEEEASAPQHRPRGRSFK